MPVRVADFSLTLAFVTAWWLGCGVKAKSHHLNLLQGQLFSTKKSQELCVVKPAQVSPNKHASRGG